MARDSQAALVALNRFGFGARGGASGDFINAASDPRGFVLAELARPNGALLEVPGLLSTPELGKQVFDYQFEIQQARNAAKQGASETPPQGPDAKPQPRRNLSLPTAAKEIAGKDSAMQAPDNANAAMTPSAPMQPPTIQPLAGPPKPPAQPLNIIQKTFRAEALARLQRGVVADCGFVERLVVFWSNHFCISANKGALARMWAGSFEREAIRPHAVATSYRDRSHFDGQDVLESGFPGPGRVQSGWLNRALEALPKGERVTSALAVGPTTPLVLRGAAPTVGWAPTALPQAADDTAMRLLDLYQHRDPALASALTQGLQLEKQAQGDEMKPKQGAGGVAAMRLVARGAAKLMAADDGPRIGALAFDGWDTHGSCWKY